VEVLEVQEVLEIPEIRETLHQFLADLFLVD
jgi:hypothetical protein